METRGKLVSVPYLAGLFDGEGCVYCTGYIFKKKNNKREYFNIQIFICNTCKEKLEQITTQYGGHIRAMQHRPHEKPVYRIEWWGRKAGDLLKLLLQDESFFIKRRQAEYALELLNYKASFKHKGCKQRYNDEAITRLSRLRDEIKHLNRRGAIAAAETKPSTQETSGSDSPNFNKS